MCGLLPQFERLFPLPRDENLIFIRDKKLAFLKQNYANFHPICEQVPSDSFTNTALDNLKEHSLVNVTVTITAKPEWGVDAEANYTVRGCGGGCVVMVLGKGCVYSTSSLDVLFSRVGHVCITDLIQVIAVSC